MHSLRPQSLWHWLILHSWVLEFVAPALLALPVSLLHVLANFTFAAVSRSSSVFRLSLSCNITALCRAVSCNAILMRLWSSGDELSSSNCNRPSPWPGATADGCDSSCDRRHNGKLLSSARVLCECYKLHAHIMLHNEHCMYYMYRYM